MTRLTALLASIPPLLFLAGPAHADRRPFAHTYEYATMPRGGLDIEIWNTQTHPDLGQDASAFELQLETEYGITDHWDVSLYQVLTQGPEDGAPLRYQETKVESRYRFAERGELPVDTVLYLEVGKSLIAKDTELEGKVILVRDLGPLTAALNLIAEIEIADETEVVPGWAFGLTYEASPAWKLGGEVFGALEETSEEPGGTEDRALEAWAGPTVSWAPSPKVWITVNAGFGLTADSDDFIARFLIGLGL